MLDMGIPSRMANAMHRLFGGLDEKKNKVIEAVLADDQRVPLATDGVLTGEGAFHHAADAAARECHRICNRVWTDDAILIAIGMVCRRRGVAVPCGETVLEIVDRALDKRWWLRHIRTEFKRRFDHVAKQLGLVGKHIDPYISRESAIMQEHRNRENQKLLEACKAVNENGDVYTLAELASKGVGNKTLRRGELMLRIRGFEEAAGVLGHVAMFWTITCPSKFHSVGGTNEKYKGFTTRQAQAYLCKVWACIRAALHRAGIKPYGFRVAEPHTDGCPHWHMLLFVDPARVNDMEMIVTAYALKEDEGENGSHENRVKLINIEAGNGTAAGYIAKYVGKNIDGQGVGEHHAFEDGRTYVITTDTLGNMEFTPSKRVTLWAQLNGIRQFQQIGGPSVTVMREVRRLTADAVQHAPEVIREAYHACQKIESEDPAVAQKASFARFIWAMGGPTCGRNAAIKLVCREQFFKGRYVAKMVSKPVGVCWVAQPHVVYESVRYQWTISGPGERAVSASFDPQIGGCSSAPWTRIAAASASTWTSVNKYTQSAETKPAAQPKNKIVSSPFDAGRISDRNHVRCAEVDHIAVYLRHRKRAPGAPSVHLEYLREKYRDRHEVPVTSLRTPSVH
jgi:hypothetical protein